MLQADSKFGMIFAAAVFSAVPIYAQQMLQEPGDTRNATPPADQLNRRNDRSSALSFVYNPTLAAFTGVRPEVEASGNLAHAVMAGDWKTVAIVLKSMPAPKAIQLHRAILESLQKDISGGQNIPSETDAFRRMPRMNEPVNRAQSMARIPLSPSDVMDLLDTLPETAPMDDSHLMLAGQLLKSSLSVSIMTTDVSTKLKHGTVRFHARDDQGRLNAVRFLLSADCPEYIRYYLPPEENVFNAPSSSLTGAYFEYALAMAVKNGINEDMAAGFRRLAVRSMNKLLGDGNLSPQYQRYIGLMVAMFRQTQDTRQFDMWISDLAERKSDLLPAVMVMMTTESSGPNAASRIPVAYVQRRLVDLISEKNPKALESSAMISVLNEFAARWITEVDGIISKPAPVILGRNAAAMAQPSISPEQLLMFAPTGYWLSVIDSRIQPRLYRSLLNLCMMADQTDMAFEYLEKLCRLSPDLDENMIEKALSLWVDNYEGVRIAPKANPTGLPSVPAMRGIPSTRIAQERKTARFAELVDKIRKIYGRDIALASLPELLNTLRGQTDMIWVADVEKIWGPMDQLDESTYLKLTYIMDANIRNAERQLSTQGLRYDAQMIENSSRNIFKSYGELMDVLKKRMLRYPADYRIALKLATVQSNYANFSALQDANSETCMKLRREAFDSIHLSSDLYAKAIAGSPDVIESSDVYAQWFSIAAGISDFNSPSFNYDAYPREFRQIASAIRSLPGNLASRHLANFASGIVKSMPQFQPATKVLIMQYALMVIGDHPLGRPIATALRSYTDLLSEVRLVAHIDGSADIGHGMPVGMLLSIEHTAQLALESGGFAKYISSNARPRTPNYNTGISNRDMLEKYIRQALSDRYVVDTIVWAQENMSPHDIAQPGWQTQPLAYIVMRAKNISVDRVPPIQIDLDFLERQSTVVLPVSSAMLVVNASQSASRPVSAIKIEQTLDDTDLSSGILTLNIKVSSHGILPSFDQLFDSKSLSGMTLEKITDRGIKYNQLVVKPVAAAQSTAALQSDSTVVSEREWLLHLRLPQTASGKTTFHFASVREPFASSDGIEVRYRQYSDRDVVEVPPSIALAGRNFFTTRTYWPWIAGSVALTLGIGGVVILSRRKPVATSGSSSEPLPEYMSAFAALAALRDILLANGNVMSVDERQQLQNEIQKIEEACFSPGADSISTDENWLPTVRVWCKWPANLQPN